MMTPLLLTSGLVRYKAVLHSCGISPVGGRVLTCDSVHLWRLYSAASLEHQAASTTTCYHTQLHYPDRVNQSLHYPNNVEHWAGERQVSILKSLV